METKQRVRIALQKKGRLNKESLELLFQCGLKARVDSNTLYCHSENLPIDLLFVRDDDIPTLVSDGRCDLGVVGENVLYEHDSRLAFDGNDNNFDIVARLGFGRCRLSIALPADGKFKDIKSLQNKSLATSYPASLRKFLEDHSIEAKILLISGSVEIATRLGMADAICDLVSTGKTLEENNLKEVVTIVHSQAVLIKTKNLLSTAKLEIIELLSRRINGTLKAQESKYILFHAPKQALSAIKAVLPGIETPTIMPLEGFSDRVAVHVVSGEGVFWGTLEKLKQAGASSILVLPIEKMLN
jgi:ATP phosphoribosyltransferase